MITVKNEKKEEKKKEEEKGKDLFYFIFTLFILGNNYIIKIAALN